MCVCVGIYVSICMYTYICTRIFVFYVFIVYIFMFACEQNPNVDGRTGPLDNWGLCGWFGPQAKFTELI